MRFVYKRKMSGSVSYSEYGGIGSGVLGVRGDGLAFGNGKGGFSIMLPNGSPSGYGAGIGAGLWSSSSVKGDVYMGTLLTVVLVIPAEALTEADIMGAHT